jgi:hypothetical protein
VSDQNTQNRQPENFFTAQGVDEAASYLAQEYSSWHALFQAQPALVQRFLESQGRKLADALMQRSRQVHFTLPDRLVVSTSGAGDAQPLVAVPANLREHKVGGIMDRLKRANLGVLLRQCLDELESNSERAAAIGGGLLRYATAQHMVHSMLPAGRRVSYIAAEEGEIPTIPVGGELEAASAITAATDAIAESDGGSNGEQRGELLVPYVEAARRFYLPQWVAFDDQDRLLVNTLPEAEAQVASMQRFLRVLHAAVALAPYMVADLEYQQKRYGMLGQLVNQGRALARYETQEIIHTIKRRAAANDLNRGLSLSLPYFDDQGLEMKNHNFDVIPGGRIMFVPGFVVLACRRELGKVAQDTRLSPSTRKHLLGELHTIEHAFITEGAHA